MHGASSLTVLRRITVRLAWPGILAAAIYIFMTAFAAFDVPAIIGWGNRIFTFTTYLYLLLNPQDTLPRYGLGGGAQHRRHGDRGADEPVAWRHAGADSRRFAVVTGRAYRPKIVKLGRRRLAAWCFIWVYLVLGKVLPIALLAWSSLLPFFQLPSARAFATVSLTLFFLAVDLALTALWNTCILAVLTPSLTLGLSLAFSWIVLRSKFPGRAVFDFIAFLPHAVPSIVFGVGALLLTLFVIQRGLPIYGTVWLLLIVFTIARLSYGTRMTNSGLIQIHTELEESALMSGGTAWDAFARISVLLLAPTLLYAWLWIALLIFRELTLAVILSTADNLTFPVVVWSLTSSAAGSAEHSALAMVMLLMMTPMIVIYWLFARRQGLLAT